VDPAALLPLLLVVPAIGGGLLWWWDPRRRARRLLARAGEKSLGAVVEGDRVRVLGTARRAQGRVNAQFSGRVCIAFRAVAELRMDTEWREVFRVEHSVPFVLAADGVEARVEGPFLLGLEIDHRHAEGELSQEVRDTLAKYGVATTDGSGRPLHLRCHEAALEDGDPIWVLGRARVAVDPRGQSDSLRGPPVLRFFEGTKRDPVILADEDSPGDVSELAR
jgi:hypothetical protein